MAQGSVAAPPKAFTGAKKDLIYHKYLVDQVFGCRSDGI